MKRALIIALAAVMIAAIAVAQTTSTTTPEVARANRDLVVQDHGPAGVGRALLRHGFDKAGVDQVLRGIEDGVLWDETGGEGISRNGSLHLC
jgi:SOS response regulatory protein OraA/RecX